MSLLLLLLLLLLSLFVDPRRGAPVLHLRGVDLDLFLVVRFQQVWIREMIKQTVRTLISIRDQRQNGTN